MPNSACRDAARASSRFAVLAHAMSNTTATMPSRTASGCENWFRSGDFTYSTANAKGSGMTALEAMVWLQRTGALDPGGHATELPDIAADLGLRDRAEARAALRRARRKLDAWTSGNFSAESLNA